MLKTNLLSGILLCLCLQVHAQFSFKSKNNNTANEGINYSLLLNQAEDDFENGKLSGIPANLAKGFVKDGFSKEEIIQARRLLTMVYLFSDNEPAAEEQMILLLKADPEHPIDPLTDPAEFQYLYQKFRTRPIFRVAFNAGFNQARVNVMDRYATTSTLTSTEQFSPKVALQYGLSIEKEILFNGQLEASLGALYSTKKYELSDVVVAGATADDNAFSEMKFIEAATYLDIPFYLRYNFPSGRSRIVPYVYAGVEGNLLFAAARTESERSGAQTISLSEQDLKVSEERNKQSYSYIGGVGFKYKVKTHFLKFEVKYSKGQTNLVNPDNRFVNQSTVFRLAHVDNNQAMDLISINLGYVLSIYNPKKLKIYR